MITDFNQAAGDQIVVSASGFGGGLVPGDLAAAQFIAGAAAGDANDRFVYNAAGELRFDADGNGAGAGASVLVAILGTHPNLTEDGILIIA
jgi:Ca2+-binding RTX toxin-like protein